MIECNHQREGYCPECDFDGVYQIEDEFATQSRLSEKEDED